MLAALGDTRVVLVNGARQAGKSTLVRMIVADRTDEPAEFRTLDDEEQLRAAQADPRGFVDFRALIVIDEVQRAPRLFLRLRRWWMRTRVLAGFC